MSLMFAQAHRKPTELTLYMTNFNGHLFYILDKICQRGTLGGLLPSDTSRLYITSLQVSIEVQATRSGTRVQGYY